MQVYLDKITTYSFKKVQEALNNDGAKPKLKVDGILGPKSLKAIVDFQFKYSLPLQDDMELVLQTLGLVPKSHNNGKYFSLSKPKRNIKVERERPSKNKDKVDPPLSSKGRTGKLKGKMTGRRSAIKIPKKKSECFKELQWIPGATIGPKVNVKGSKHKTPTGKPYMITGHFTAGWNKVGSAWSSLERTKYAFLCIDITGELLQPANMPTKAWGYHAGTSKFDIVGYGKTSSCSNKGPGVEMNCGGRLKYNKKTGEWETWFGKVVPKKDRRYLAKTTDDWGPKGWYEKLSKEQEETFIDYCVFMCLNYKECKWQNITVHHEISGKKYLGRWRKNDTGGSFSMPASKIRETVRKRVEAVLSK